MNRHRSVLIRPVPRLEIGCEVAPGGVLDTISRLLKSQELNATAIEEVVRGIDGLGAKYEGEPKKIVNRKLVLAKAGIVNYMGHREHREHR